MRDEGRAAGTVDDRFIAFADDFSIDLAFGRVIGSKTPAGIRRDGIDREGVIGIEHGALRIRPLAIPGWGRAGLAYGPQQRRNGLALAVHILNGDNGSFTFKLKSLVGRLGRWTLASETDPVPRRLLRWPAGFRQETGIRRVYRWACARFVRRAARTLAENLAVGWFPAAVPDDPTAAGHGFVVRGDRTDNAQLAIRSAGRLMPVTDALQNLPFHYIVVLRETGAAYYTASYDGVRGAAGYPWMRPVGIDPWEREPWLHPGLHQSVLGEIGFAATTAVYGVKVADVREFSRWSGTAQAADDLTGEGPVAGSRAAAGGVWRALDRSAMRGSDGAIASGASCAMVLRPDQPSGLIHLVASGLPPGQAIGLIWRMRDEGSQWRLTVTAEACILQALHDGKEAMRREADMPPRAGDARLSLQLLDNEEGIQAFCDGEPLWPEPLDGALLRDACGVGFTLTGGPRAVAVRDFEAHPRRVPIPDVLRLDPAWAPPESCPLLAESFAGERADLAGLRSPGGFAWQRVLGCGRLALDGKGGAVAVADREASVPDRTAYAVDWPDPELADLRVSILPPGDARGQGHRGRGGVIFWQDERNYFIVNTWLSDSFGGSSISSFFYFNGSEDIYDAVWTNVGDRLYHGRRCDLRVVCDGRRYRVELDGEPVLYRAFADVYPSFDRLRITKVGLVMNWEWGRDTGSRFLGFSAARGVER